MFLHFTTPARRALAWANAEAHLAGSECIATAHILLGIAHVVEGAGGIALGGFGAGLSRLRPETGKLVRTHSYAAATGKLPMSPRAGAAYKAGMDAARVRRCDCVGTADLLVGLLRDDNSIAVQVLLNIGLTVDAVRAAVIAEAAATDEEWASPLWARPQTRSR